MYYIESNGFILFFSSCFLLRSSSLYFSANVSWWSLLFSYLLYKKVEARQSSECLRSQGPTLVQPHFFVCRFRSSLDARCTLVITYEALVPPRLGSRDKVARGVRCVR